MIPVWLRIKVTLGSLVVGVVLAIVAVSVIAQNPGPPPAFKPTEIQLLKLQVRQRDAWLAQRDFIESQRRYQQAIADLNSEGEAVRKENAWPETVTFNADTIEFTAAPKPPVTAPTPPVESSPPAKPVPPTPAGRIK